MRTTIFISCLPSGVCWIQPGSPRRGRAGSSRLSRETWPRRQIPAWPQTPNSCDAPHCPTCSCVASSSCVLYHKCSDRSKPPDAAQEMLHAVREFADSASIDNVCLAGRHLKPIIPKVFLYSIGLIINSTDSCGGGRCRDYGWCWRRRRLRFW